MKDNYFSFLKGVAIIAVVIIHTAYAGYYPSVSSAFMRQGVTFAVGLFYLLSGYFVSSKNSSFAGAMGGANRIIIPYIIWSLLWFFETTIKGTQPVDTWKIVNTIFFGGAFFPLYFLIVLVELKLITPFLLNHINAQDYRISKDWVLLITPLTFLVFYYYQYSTHIVPIVQEQIFPTWLIYYYVGLLYKKDLIKISNLTCIVGVLLGIYFMGLESAFILKTTEMIVFAASMVKYSTIIFTVSLCILLMNSYQKINSNIVVKFGEYSFGIYLLHIPIKKYLIEYPFHVMGFNGPLYQPIVVIITLFVTFSMVWILNKSLPERICKLLGII
jgi:peptidoglycan/LPS O-acetylase OafA/YrhL